MVIAGRSARSVAVATVGLIVAACLPTATFVCGDDDQCSDLGESARCEVVGFCSVVDQNCESGRRFHEFAGEGFGGQCTDVSCGDGEMQPGEECDDGNDVDGDGCNRDCRVSGQELWRVDYASPGDGRDRCYSVATDSQGNVAVVGHITTAGQGYNLWVRQFDPEGEPQWTWVLNGDGDANEEGWSILSVDNDEWLVAGEVATNDEQTNMWIGRINGNGILVWEATWDGGLARTDQARDITLADNGDIVAIGYADVDPARETDLWFQRRSPDGQTIDWTQHRPGLDDNAQDRGHGIAKIAGGYVGVGVKQTAAEEQRFWVERFDESGDTVWADEATPGSPSSVWTAVAPTPEGDVLLAGWLESAAGDSDMWLQLRSADGEILWDEIIGSPGGDDDKANVLVIDERGGFIVGGEMGAGAGSTDAWIRRYAPDRSEVWTISYSGPAGDRDTTWGLDIAPDRSVYACGYQATPGSEWDLWVRRLTP